MGTLISSFLFNLETSNHAAKSFSPAHVFFLQSSLSILPSQALAPGSFDFGQAAFPIHGCSLEHQCLYHNIFSIIHDYS